MSLLVALDFATRPQRLGRNRTGATCTVVVFLRGMGSIPCESQYMKHRDVPNKAFGLTQAFHLGRRVVPAELEN